MLCKDCPHCRTKIVGFVSTRSFCMLSKGSEAAGTKLGVIPWASKPHPKCPLPKGQAV